MSLKDIENAIIPNNTEKIAERYSENTELRALVAAVPYIGGSLDILVTQEAQKFRERRIKVVLDAASREIERLGAEKLDQSYLVSEEWFDLIFSSLEKAIKIGEERRLKAVGKVLAYAATRSDELNIPPVDLVSILTELSDQEAFILGLINYIYKERQDLLTGTNEVLFTTDNIKVLAPKTLHSCLDLLCSRLCGKGLLDSIFENRGLNDAGRVVAELYSNE